MKDITNKIVFGTGHRPDKLGGYGTGEYHKTPEYKKVFDCAIWALQVLEPSQVISGCALGWDIALMEAAIQLDIPVTAAIPFDGFNSVWRHDCKAYLNMLLSFKSVNVHTVCDPGYEPYKLQIRNRWMVEHGELGLALWNGSSSGTGNCIKYLRQIGKPFANAWTLWEKM